MIQQTGPLTGRRLTGGLATGPRGGTFRPRRPDPKPVDATGVHWVCARVRSGREFAVADDLRIIGYRTFCPHGVKVYLNARIGPSGKRGRRERDYPVFGSYLFVGAPAGFVLTRDSHPHVYAVVENCGTRDIPASFIEMASEMWVSGRWDGRGQASTDIQPSDRVRVSLGRLGELEAVVDSLPTETHAIIRFAMFGKTHTRRVDIERLEMV